MEKKIGGFSLAELLIVIAILSIMGSIAVVSYRSYSRNTDLRTAARDVSSDFSRLKERAIAEGIQYRMTFSPGDNNYLIERGTATGTSFVTIETKTPSLYGSGIVISSADFGGSQSVGFQTRGTADSGAVTLTNAKGSVSTISVNVTGRTNVQFNMH